MLQRSIDGVLGLVRRLIFTTVSAIGFFFAGECPAPLFAQPDPKLPQKLDRFDDPLPPGAVLRLGSERFLHSLLVPDILSGVRFFPDGKILACSDGGDRLKLFDAVTGRLRGQIRAEERSILGFTITLDGKQIYSWGMLRLGLERQWQPAVRAWDAVSFKAIKTIPIPVPGNGQVRALILTEKRKLAVPVAEGVKLWDFEEGKEIASVPLAFVTTVAVSPDQATIAIASQEALYLWKWQEKQDPRRFPPKGNRGARALCFSPDGTTIAVGPDNAGDDRIMLRNVVTGKLVRAIPLPKIALDEGMTFTPDGRYLIAADSGGYTHGSGGAQIWNVETGERVRYLPTPGEFAWCVRVSPDGTRLAVESFHSIHVWDLKTWKELSAEDLGHRAIVTAMCCTPQNQIITTSFDHTVRLWDSRDGRQLQKFRCGSWVPSAAVSPNGTRVAAMSYSDELFVWDAATGKTVFQLPGHGQGNCVAVAFTPDGKKLLSFGADAFLRITDLATGKALVEHALRPEGVMVPDADADEAERLRFADRLIDCVFSPDGCWFGLNLFDGLRIFDVATGKEIRKIEGFGGRHTKIAFSADSRSLYAGRSDQEMEKGQSIRIWNMADGQLTFSKQIAEKGFGEIAFAPDGKSFAVGLNQPRQLLIFNLGNDKPLRSIDLPYRPRKLVFVPDGKRIVCSFEESGVLVFDVHPAKAE